MQLSLLITTFHFQGNPVINEKLTTTKHIYIELQNLQEKHRYDPGYVAIPFPLYELLRCQRKPAPWTPPSLMVGEHTVAIPLCLYLLHSAVFRGLVHTSGTGRLKIAWGVHHLFHIRWVVRSRKELQLKEKGLGCSEKI